MKVGYLTPEEIGNQRDYAAYIQQELGTPYPSGRQFSRLGGAIKSFYKRYPHLDGRWDVLCRIVEFAKNRGRRPPEAFMVVNLYRYAWSAGYLPELDPVEILDDDTEAEIEEVLKSEEDPEWRKRLLTSVGPKARSQALEAWRQAHG